MNSLPHSIESALEEAGFTLTEVLILKRLIDEDALTVRELATKTGKSTGLIDQAMKKLVRKEVVEKEWINGAHKYAVTSLDAVARWMSEELRKKHEAMLRKHQNFEAFLSTLKIDRQRPDMHFYEGLSGIAQAYRDLLKDSTEVLSYFPVYCTAEEDPLREFRVEYFRERRRRGIFHRVIAHNTTLGRRFHSRDAFEYRQTALVPETQYPYSFEKVISGNAVACINHQEKRACIMRYPELSAMEKGVFDGLWNHYLHSEGTPEAPAQIPSGPTAPVISIPLSTRTLSALREFFLSRKSIVAFAILATVSAIVTFGMYTYAQNLEFEHMQETIRSIASTGAHQIDPADVKELQKEDDWKKPQWATVVRQLEQIRRSNPDITFVYIFRKSLAEPKRLEFVADSHSINPYANTDADPTNDVDADRDGSMGDGDVLQWPGQIYPDPPVEALAGFNDVTVSKDFYTDFWGTYISGYAPITDAEGNAIAVLAVDMGAKALQSRLSTIFEPFVFFVALFLVFVLIRLAAFNRSLMRELWHALPMKKILISVGVCAAISAAITFSLYQLHLSWAKEKIGEKVLTVATTGALQFDARDLDQLHTIEDIWKPEYAKVISKLNQIRYQNTGIKYAYIMRPTDDPDFYEFVADADSLDPFAKIDLNGDGIVDEKDHLSPPGEPYDITNQQILTKALNEPITEIVPITQWGAFISGWSPIRDSSGKTVAVLGIDKFLSDAIADANKNFPSMLWFLGILVLLLVIRFASANFSFVKEVWGFFKLRKILVTIILCAEISFFATLGLYYYVLRMTMNEIGSKLTSIVATGSQQFDTTNLDGLRRSGDMRTETYQKVFSQLNTIRNLNKDANIKYIYIMRLADERNRMTEFVADADSNHYIAYKAGDSNADGLINDQDTIVWPGQRYYNRYEYYLLELQQPTYNPDFEIDQWGTMITAGAPISDQYILNASTDVSDIYTQLKQKFQMPLWFIGIFSIIVSLFFLFRSRR